MISIDFFLQKNIHSNFRDRNFLGNSTKELFNYSPSSDGKPCVGSAVPAWDKVSVNSQVNESCISQDYADTNFKNCVYITLSTWNAVIGNCAI
jgi:hypothetical protein